MSERRQLTRRTMLASALALSGVRAATAQSAWPTDRRLTFSVIRNQKVIGRHSLSFSVDGRDIVVAIDAEMRVGIGPITLFRYDHQATETWRDGHFIDLRSHSVTNGRREWVLATRTGDGVAVQTEKGSRTLPQPALPLTHWNLKALDGPLFNPQTGAPMHVTVSRQDGPSTTSAGATRVALGGEVQIVDWYDPGGVWTALHAKAQDGSFIDYRRVA